MRGRAERAPLLHTVIRPAYINGKLLLGRFYRPFWREFLPSLLTSNF